MVKVIWYIFFLQLPAVSPAIDVALQQKLLDQYRQDSQNVDTELQHQKQRQIDDMKVGFSLTPADILI